ncbi:MAG: hypothetical protein ACFFDN_02020 [Candidatus Hodarchaeota archaeon]
MKIINKYNSLKDIYNNLLAKKSIYAEKIKEYEKEIKKSKRRLISIEKAQILLQTVAKELQNTLQIHIEDIVQSALDSCFPNEYDFNIIFEIKRGQTEVNIFLQNGDDSVDPLNEIGGGVVDIISIALRLASWSLSQTDSVIILDEPFKFLSADLRNFAGEMLKNLSEKLNLQIIMVTHMTEMINISNKVFEIDKKNKVSFVVK